MMRIAVLGVSGMLGSLIYRVFSAEDRFAVFGTMRSDYGRRFFPGPLGDNIASGIDVEHPDALVSALRDIRPDVVINCVGVVKQLGAVNDPLVTIPINAILPHRLARLCDLLNARLVHISTDCVFSGHVGNYREADQPDAEDLYGRSKLLGETAYPNSITLRTSIIGRELSSSHGLLEWFLHQEGEVRGFTKAIFSGVTTDELARIIMRHVLPMPTLSGIYHVGGPAISKYDLLQIVKSVYGHDIRIVPDASVVIDRSLDSSRFREAAGYTAPSWNEMIHRMRELETRHTGS